MSTAVTPSDARWSALRRVVRNITWNWAGMAISILAGFVVAPFLVRELGQTSYGLWILIASLLYYFGLLDMGIRGAVGRQIALHRARGDREGLNATLSTSLAMLCIAGAVALACTVAVSFGFFHLFDVPAELTVQVRTSLLLVGLGLTIWLPLSPFEAVLWGYQRFDLLNAVDIVGAVTRTGLIFWWLGRGGSLVDLAIIYVATQLGMLAMKIAAVFWIDRRIRVGPHYVRRSAAGEVLGIGLWNMLLSLAAVVNGQVGSAIIGARLGVVLVTPFSIAARLMTYGRDFLVASTGVLTPVAISLHAAKNHGAEQRLFLKGGKYCLAVAMFFVTVYSLLGRAVIGLWIGPDLAWAGELLLILVLGEAVPMSQWVSYSVLLGKYLHRPLAIAAVVENVAAIGMALALVGPYGTHGVCLAFALPATGRGIFQLVYCARVVGVPLWQYAVQVALPVLLAAALPAALLAEATSRHVPRTWRELIIYGVGYALAYGVCLACMTGYSWLRQRGRRPPAEDAPEGSWTRRIAFVIQEVW